MDLWQRCQGRDHIRRLRATPWRVVEAQHINATRKLVDSDEEQAILEAIVDRAKPPMPREPAFEGLHYLLFTPFRYPPLRHGSRFGRRHERGIWYGSERLHTAFAEVAFYRFLFVEGSSADLTPLRVYVSAFRIGVRGARGVDLTRPPFAEHEAALTSVTSYAVTQALGAAMRQAGVQLFRYRSARDVRRGRNIALFEPVFLAKAPPLPETWLCTTESDAVELHPVHVPGRSPLRFPRSQYLHGGRLPVPPCAG